MKITYTVTKEDFWNFNKHINYDTRESKLKLAISMLLYIFACMLIYYLTYSIIAAIVIPIPAFLLMLYMRYPNFKRKVYKYAEYTLGILDKNTLEIKEEGISITSFTYNRFYKWSIISSIKITDNYLFIFFNKMSGIIVPKRVFSSEDQVIRFYNVATTFIEKSQE